MISRRPLTRVSAAAIVIAGAIGTSATSTQAFVIPSNYIDTFAGGGTSTSDGILATDARLAPFSGTADGDGNLYVSESAQVRRVDWRSRTVSTVAGTGTLGFSGDGGPATAATFSNVSGVAVDAATDLFIADYGNARIRKVDGVTGTISTYIGGGSEDPDGALRGNAMLARPENVVVDSTGRLYFDEGLDPHSSSKVAVFTMDPRDGVVHKLPIEFSTGVSLAIDSHDRLWVAGGDPSYTLGFQIYDPTTATTSRLSTSVQFRSPDIAIDKRDNSIFAFSYAATSPLTGTHLIQIDPSTGAMTKQVAGDGTDTNSGDGGLARTAGVVWGGLTVGPLGNVYLFSHDRVRAIACGALHGTGGGVSTCS